MKIERGWFYLADLRPRRGTEPGKTRPVLVLQSDLLSLTGHPSTIVVPLTTRIVDDAEPLRVRVPARTKGLKPSDILVDQIRAIDNRRLCEADSGKPLKRLAPATLQLIRTVESCLRQILDFS